MKKTLKTKVLAGTVTVALLSSAGLAFANTDAGAAFQQWYNKQFKVSEGIIVANTAAYGAVESAKAWKEYEDTTKPNAGNEIDKNRDSEIGEAKTAITAATDKHVGAVEDKKVEIIANMDKDFEGITSSAKDLISKAGIVALEEAEKDLTGYTEDKGGKALEAVRTQIGQAQTEAYNKLDKTIKDAKFAVNFHLKDKTLKTTGEIKGAIDDEISRVKGKVDDIVKDLVKAQNEIVTAEANKLEAEALASLDGLVNGINK